MPTYMNPGWGDVSVLMDEVARRTLKAAARRAGSREPDVAMGAIWLKLKDCRPDGKVEGSNPMAFIYKTIRSTAANAYRSDRERPISDAYLHRMRLRASPPQPFESMTRDEVVSTVREAFERLSTTDRRMIADHFGYEEPKVPLAEIASRLGLSEPTTRKRVRAALARFRRELLKNGLNPEDFLDGRH